MPVTLNDIAMSLAGMKSALDVHMELTKANDATLAKMYKDIYIGHGEKPLRERVNKLEACPQAIIEKLDADLSNLEKKIPKLEEWTEIKQWVTLEQKFAWLVVAGVVTQTLILVFQLVKSMLSSGAL